MPPVDKAPPTHVDVRESLRMGWERGATHFLQFALVLVVVLLTSGLLEYAAGLVSQWWLHLALFLLGIAVPWALGFGVCRLALPIADGQPVTWRSAWAFKGLPAYLVASLILVPAVGILTVATLGVALVLAAPLVSFVPFFILDHGSDRRQSIRESWVAGAVHYSDMVRLTLVLLALNLIGFITVLGWFITVPMTAIAIAHAYRTATGPAGPRP